MRSIVQLQEWFAAQCDGDWEHGHGVVISTIDNPGWSLNVDLHGVALENRSFASVKIERGESDWVHASKSGGHWKAYGGPKNLEEMITLFLEWSQI